MAKLCLENLNKVYDGNVVAVKDVNLVIEDKEFLVLVGPSGCGKSTILRMIAGLEDITSGNIFIGDTRVNDVLPKDRDIAMVFQNYALYPHMSVYNNLAFALKIRKMPKQEIAEKVRKVAEILEIEELLQRKPKQLSGGQRQRVALGRAIIRETRICLMDEPISNLDAKLRGQMRAEICRLYKRLNTTMVYVTHDQTEAMTMGSKIVVLQDGIIQQVDTPNNIYQKPANTFVAGFIGTPPMNLINAEIIEKDSKLLVRFQQGSFMLPEESKIVIEAKGYVGKPINFGIRAEDIVLSNADVQMQPIVGTVDVIENLGAESHIHFNTQNGELIVKVHPGTEVRMEEKVDLYFDVNKVHLFDKETSKRIV
jgi:multiple sugar transport system ATP-binding protein